MPSVPRSALLLRPDGMGDLVLFEPVLRALRKAWPQARLTILVRNQSLQLGRLLVSGWDWRGTDIDPWRHGPGEASAELAQLRQIVAELQPDLVVACTDRRNWLDAAVAGMAPGARRIAFGEVGDDAYFGPQLRSLYPEIPEPAFDETVLPGEGEQDWRRNFGLVTHLVGESNEPEAPRLPSGEAWAAAALPQLEKWGLQPEAYVVCAAAGFANVPIKTWPAERFASVLRWLKSSRGLPAVLVGSESEAEYLAPIARETGSQVWTPSAGGWPALCSLLLRSRLCVGNDTGVLHLAAAAGRPVVGIYGGGTWPRFVPAGPGAVVVNPLPCFGCGWDCTFGDAPCVKVIAAEEVQTVVGAVLDRHPVGECAIFETHQILPETAEMMGAAARRWKEQAAALDRREQEFQETVRLASAKDGEIAALKLTTDEMEREIIAQNAEMALLKDETDGKDREIAALKLTTDKMEQEIVAQDAEIVLLKTVAEERARTAVGSAADADQARREAAIRAQEIEKLHRACAELQSACDERLALIIRLDGEVKALMRQQGRGPV